MDPAALVVHAQHAVEQASWLAYPLVFAGGAVTGLNPCVYPTIPVIIGYVGGQKGTRGLRGLGLRGLALAATFVLGLALTYVILGATASFVGSVLGLSRAVWLYIVAGVCVLVGLQMTGLVSLPTPSVEARPSASRAGSVVGALLLGMMFGVVAAPCALPIVALILAVSASSGRLLYGSSLMFVYALGHGLPLVVLGAVTGAVSGFAGVTKYAAAIQRASGWLLLAVAAWLIWTA